MGLLSGFNIVFWCT
ncbi:putative transposase, partial [Yersinia pestis PY-99]